MEVPETEEPDIELAEAEVSDIELPEAEVPEMPVEEIPAIEEPAAEVPEPEVPDIEMPEAEIPEMPVEEIPAVEEPMAEVPVTDMPEVEIPEIAETEVPATDESEPEMPQPEVSDLEIPDIEIPDEETARVVIAEAEASDTAVPEEEVPGLDDLNIEFIKTESADTEELEKSLENITSSADLVAHDDNSIIDKVLLSKPEEPHDDDMMSEAEMDALLAAFDKKEERKREKAEEAEIEAIFDRMKDDDVKAAINDTLSEVTPVQIDETISSSEAAPADVQPVEETPADTEPAEEMLSEDQLLDEILSDESLFTEPSTEEPLLTEPVADEPVMEEPVLTEPLPDEPVAEEPMLTEPLPEEPDIPGDVEDLLKDIETAEPEGTSEVADDQMMSEEQVDELLKSIEEMGDPTSGSVPEESELSDIIAESDDADIAEIGELLDKNDNFEAVDPSITEDDSSYDIPMPGLDNMSSEEEEAPELSPKEKKRLEKQAKKEQKKREKEEKKKRKAGIEPIPAADPTGEFAIPSDDEAFEAEMDEALAGMEFTDVPDEYDGVDLEVVEKGDEASSRKKKNGFFAKLARALTEPVDGEDEENLEDLTAGVFAEETAKDIAKAGAEDNEQILKEMEDEEPEEGKGKKGKKGKKEKKEKKAKEKKPKKEKQRDKELFKMPKLPKKRVALIMLCTLSLGVLIGVASMVLPYYTDVKDARAAFEGGDYQSTFMSLTGHKLNAEQQELYNKNLILYKLQQKLKSYRNYLRLGMMPDALNSLVQGIKDVDELKDSAAEYGITDQFDAYAGEITYELDNTFGVSADQARSWLELEDSREYTRALYEHIDPKGTSVAAPAGEVTPAPVPDLNNSVIEGEESEFVSD
ncbi:MAG: hypothetical protein IKT17_00555, partial [Lachnospiraceae bacterium]|nr:hypothetical protein [Lachnospiraceae bacterium]